MFLKRSPGGSRSARFEVAPKARARRKLFMTADTMISSPGLKIDWTRLIALLTGFGLFLVIYYSPSWPDAVDPAGKHFVLSAQGKGAIAVFALAGIWWVFEVVPIGVTSLVIGVTQALFMIRPAKQAFNDFMDPSVLFIFASLIIGLVFNKTGLTKRMAYKMLSLVGEKTTTIYLGVFLLCALLPHRSGGDSLSVAPGHLRPVRGV
jgi:sodium-dependent dicarboxylate transporter 2/3/5